MKVRQKQNGQIFVNENGLFNVYVFFQGQEYDITEVVYNYKPSIFEVLEPKSEQFEPKQETKIVEQSVDFEPKTKEFEPKIESELKEEQVEVKSEEKPVEEQQDISTEPDEMTEFKDDNVEEKSIDEQVEKEQHTEKKKSRKK